MEFAASFMEFTGEGDGARKAWKIKQMITEMQNSFNVIEKCPQPVIAAVHSACIGGGVDMIAACDVRLCSSDAWIQIKVCVDRSVHFAKESAKFSFDLYYLYAQCLFSLKVPFFLG